MHHNHSHFAGASGMPPTMNYTLKFLDEPIFSTNNWLELHAYALARGYAINAWGCLFTLMPNVTVGRR